MVDRHPSADRLMRTARVLIDATLAMEGDLASMAPEGALAIEHTVTDIEGALRSVRHLTDQLLVALARMYPGGDTRDLALSRPRVLVVDDAAEVRDLLAMILRGEGFDVFTAGDGLEALVVAHAARPMIILMDVTMPVLDGIEATRLLKAATITRHVPVIAHTGVPATCADAADRLFAQVLSKPVDPSVLVALVQRFLAQPSPAQARG